MKYKDLVKDQEFTLPGNPDVLVKINDGPCTTQKPEYHRKWYHLFFKTTTYKIVESDEGMAGYKKWWCGEKHGFGGGTFVKPDQEVILV